MCIEVIRCYKVKIEVIFSLLLAIFAAIVLFFRLFLIEGENEYVSK